VLPELALLLLEEALLFEDEEREPFPLELELELEPRAIEKVFLTDVGKGDGDETK
jgi:hypothetical protein